MSEERQIMPGLIDGFSGENRDLSEHLLPAGVSPESLNVDYDLGRVSSRGGAVRLHTAPVYAGGLKVNSAQDFGSGGSHAFSAHRASYLFTDDFTIELYASARWTLVDGLKSVLRHGDGDHNTAATEGVHLYLKEVAGSYSWACAVGHSGVASLEVVGPQAEAGRDYVVSVSYEVGSRQVSLWVDGTRYTGTLPGAYTYAPSAMGMALGDSAGSAPGTWFVVDELRVWNDFDIARSVRFSDERRELFLSERTTRLLSYWTFDATEATVLLGNRLYPNHGVETAVMTAYPAAYPSRGMAAGPAGSAAVTGLQGVLGARPMTQVLIGTANDAFVLDLSDGSVRHLHALATPAPGRWQGAMFDGWTLFVNGAGQNLRYKASAGVRLLSLQAPTDDAGATAVASAGGGVDDGAHSYLFTFRDSTSGAESAAGLFVVDVTTGTGSNTVDLSDLPVTDQPGVDQLRIYRTAAGGTVYYLAGTVDNGTTSYSDAAADSALGAKIEEFTGHGGPSTGVVVHDERVWLLGQSDNLCRAQYSERGVSHAFYRNNYVYVGRNDGDRLVAGASLGETLVLFKERGIWVVSGPPFAARELYPGEGCVAGATVAPSPFGVFYLGAGGVMLLPSDVGAPVNIGWGRIQTVLRALEESDYPRCSGAWDPARQRYVLSVPLGGAMQTLVWDHPRKTWARWDLAAEAWALIYPDGAAGVLGCGWRGYLAQLGTETSEGVQVSGGAVASAGTASGGTTAYLEDSGAAWTPGSLIGVDVAVGGATRRVWWNTATRLYVSPGFVTAPAAGAAYTLGALTCHWRSPRMLFNGDFGGEKCVGRVRAIFGAVTAANPAVSLRWRMETGTEQSVVVDAGVRLADQDAVDGALGREGYVGVAATSADTRFSLEAIGVTFEERVGYPGV